MQTPEEKKEYLRSYLKLKREALSKAELIEHIEGQEMGRAITYSAAPISGSSHHDLSDIAVKLDEACTEMIKANEAAVQRMREIIAAINEMDDVDEKILLRKRYIMGEKWEQIAIEMHLSWKQTFRRHGSALQHFQIPGGEE